MKPNCETNSRRHAWHLYDRMSRYLLRRDHLRAGANSILDRGAVAVTVILLAIDSYLGRDESHVTIFEASVVAFCVLVFRKGSVGEHEDYWQRRVRRKINGASPS